MSTADAGRTARTQTTFSLTPVWPKIDEQDATDLMAFWKREAAIPGEAQATARLQQAVLWRATLMVRSPGFARRYP